jgi:hypothetical protein
MGIAVAFTNAETKGRSRERTQHLQGKPKSVTTGREGNAVGAIFRRPKQQRERGKANYLLAGSPSIIGFLLKQAAAIPVG